MGVPCLDSLSSQCIPTSTNYATTLFVLCHFLRCLSIYLLPLAALLAPNRTVPPTTTQRKRQVQHRTYVQTRSQISLPTATSAVAGHPNSTKFEYETKIDESHTIALKFECGTSINKHRLSGNSRSLRRKAASRANTWRLVVYSTFGDRQKSNTPLEKETSQSAITAKPEGSNLSFYHKYATYLLTPDDTDVFGSPKPNKLDWIKDNWRLEDATKY